MGALIFGMIHNLPQTPAFRDERPDSPISEIALRVLVEFEGGKTHVIGTATLIGAYLAITAKHVLEHALREFGVLKKATASQEVRDYAIRLYRSHAGSGLSNLECLYGLVLRNGYRDPAPWAVRGLGTGSQHRVEGAAHPRDAAASGPKDYRLRLPSIGRESNAE